MPRRLPQNVPEFPDGATSFQREIVKKYEISVVTPIFRGGPREYWSDPENPVRATSVRGNLRFWWRATKGAALANSELLYGEESKIWGKVKTPSSVFVSVKYPKRGRGREILLADYDPNRKVVRVKHPFPYYFLFGLTSIPNTLSESEIKNHYVKGIDGVKFILTIAAPEKYLGDVKCALWAWVNFGGVGARTRRGFGALYCKDLSPPATTDNLEKLRLWFRDCKTQYAITHPSTTPRWPRLHSHFLAQLHLEQKDFLDLVQPLVALGDLSNLYHGFRQGGGFARARETGNRLGRSYWPEAESVRKITGYRLEGARSHKKQSWMPEEGFPRAELGLPITFIFRDRFKKSKQPQETQQVEEPLQTQQQNDPPNSTIIPYWKEKIANRMASPIILKPVAVSPFKTFGACIRLQEPPIEGIQLSWWGGSEGNSYRQSYDMGAESVVNPVFSQYSNAPMRELSERGSSVDAFMNFMEKSDYGRVN